MAQSVSSPMNTRSISSTYTGSTVSLPIRPQDNLGQGGVAIIKEGQAQVKEGKGIFAGWKNRYLVLRKENIDFHKVEGGKVSYSIILKDVLGVSRVEASGNIFEIRRSPSGSSGAPGDDDNGVKVLWIKTKSDDDLYEWIDYIYARCPGMGGVSNPTNFAHAVHVGFDPTSGEFVGLPNEWSKLLNSSAITKEDYERNPQAVFEVLEFYSDIQNRDQNPQQFSSLTPTPPVTNNNNKQLGYGGGLSGTSIAPPRPAPPSHNNSYQNGSGSPSSGRRQPTPPEQLQQRQQMQQMAGQYNPNVNREEERQRLQEQQRQRDEDQNRRDMEAYNAQIPQTRTPAAQQEIGGGGYSNNQSQRYNPTRAAPPAPGALPRQPTGELRAQRQAPSAPTSNAQQSSASKSQTSQRTESPGGAKYQANGAPQPLQTRAQNGQNQQQPSRLPAPVVKPLNVAAKQPTGVPVQNGVDQTDAVKAAEAALTAKPPATERSKDVRMSTMSEHEVMAKLKEAVSKDDPSMSYVKQKKIGQGASGSVYVAKVKENPLSPVARQVLKDQGGRAQVAIKQMDLAHQPRKELIVNEIMVMKDSRHPNIVNFLDAFLRNNFSELWVVMEFMEGGALTDVIDNNSNITEDQISTICLEVYSFS